MAGVILQTYPQLSGHAGKRYQFKTKDYKNELIKIVFDRAYKRANEVGNIRGFYIDAWMAKHNRYEMPATPFCPKWKQIVYIKLPKIAGKMVGNEGFVGCFTTVAYYTHIFAMGYLYYKLHVVTANRIIPAIVKHLPEQVIRLSPLANALGRIYCIFIAVIGVCFALKWLASKSNMPRVNRILERVDFLNILKRLPKPMIFPLDLGASTVKCAIFAFELCGKLSKQLKDIARRGEQDQLASSRNKAFEVWKGMMLRQVG